MAVIEWLKQSALVLSAIQLNVSRKRIEAFN